MGRRTHSFLIDFTGVILVGLAISMITLGNTIENWFSVSSAFQNLNTIFLSILIEAVPFVLIGVLIAGFIQIFITEEHIQKWIPKNKFLAVTMSCVVGAAFPACECGIVPIVRRLIAKGVPIYAGIGFLLTGPLINPIVIFSTYMAFGNDFKIAAMRMILGFAIAMIIALIISLFVKGNQLKPSALHANANTNKEHHKQKFSQKIWGMLTHSVDEFFDMVKYLIIGAFLAAAVQVYVSSETLLGIGTGVVSSTLVMMGLAYVLSLCSEADAFIGASFRNLFPTTAIMGFLIYGPMIDLKNTFMMLSVFKARFVFFFVALVTIVVLSVLILVQGIL
ncbi:hypothetical protein HNQ94_000809 [Salirhabdus euzebyi]|uniref:Permease n=1 Tax=Salirhabdus euzebyi TaxID=394506 RepID=A0A841PWS2_9BACI|nr:permease [Salirhabdus euzebyi]MBB6452364.1 hypothetical protein [Salirhabdus euzebyi]